jgi:hypothetical protein
MRKTLRACALLVALWGCGSSGDAPTSQYAIEGRVLDDLTGDGLEHATVHFSSDTLDSADASTDRDGHFSLQVSVREGVDFGVVSAERDSYQPTAQHTVYFDGTEHVLTLRMRAKTTASK